MCQTTQDGPVVPTSPDTSRPRTLCPPEVVAASKAEPIPPAYTAEKRGAVFDFILETFGEEYAQRWWEWHTVTFPNWGREGWIRLDTARAKCLAEE